MGGNKWQTSLWLGNLLRIAHTIRKISTYTSTNFVSLALTLLYHWLTNSNTLTHCPKRLLWREKDRLCQPEHMQNANICDEYRLSNWFKETASFWRRIIGIYMLVTVIKLLKFIKGQYFSPEKDLETTFAETENENVQVYEKERFM